MSRLRAASAEDYTLGTMHDIFNEGQAGGLGFSSVSINNDETDFVNPTTLRRAGKHDKPLSVKPVYTALYWGRFGHPMLQEYLETIYEDGESSTDWQAIRRTILRSSVGSVIFNRSSLNQGTNSRNTGDGFSEDRLAATCADVGAPFSVYQTARILGSDRPKLAFLWFPTIISSQVSLAYLQSAVALRINP
jgi:hypothetical protein